MPHPRLGARQYHIAGAPLISFRLGLQVPTSTFNRKLQERTFGWARRLLSQDGELIEAEDIQLVSF